MGSQHHGETLGFLFLSLLLRWGRASAAFANQTANIDLVARLVFVFVHVVNVDLGKIISILFVRLFCYW